jgi:hypothetical protein
MKRPRGKGGVVGALTLAALALGAGPVEAQIAEAARAVRDGGLTFSYPVRPGTRICSGADRGFSVTGGAWISRDDGEDAPREACREGSALVEVTLEGGMATDVTLVAPGRSPAAGSREVGRVAPEVAVRWLLDDVVRADPVLARDAVEGALVAAVIADSVVVWPDLLEVTLDRDIPSRTRKSAIFWLGQEAAEVVTDALVATAGDDSEAAEIREAAVFAISQGDPGESVPALMTLAREAPAADTRRSALFWLAQSDDPRVPAFFGEILRAGPGAR